MSLMIRHKAACVGKNLSLLGVLLVLLTGCSGGNVDDLQAYVNEVRSSSKGRIEPLPEFVPVKNFTYGVNEYPDPFVSWDVRAAQMAKEERASAGTGGLQPDLGRRREALESFPLDTLRMVGTMEKGGKSSALVQSPEGLVSRIVVGNYLGQNYGKVISIDKEKIELIEIVPDGLGSWVQRNASLALVE